MNHYTIRFIHLGDKVTSVTTTGNNQNIVFLYDPFVAAGAAVAFPTQGAVAKTCCTKVTHLS